MAGHPRLYRRGATYYLRPAITIDIKDTYPKSEETFSRNTKDHAEAIKLVRVAAVKVDRKFEAHRRNIDTPPIHNLKLASGSPSWQREEHGLDCYGRTLATIYVWHDYKGKWINVNERMVTLGHAWVMRRFYDHLPKGRQVKLNGLERWSRSKRIGLWQTSNPIPPWKWRNQR